MRIFLATLTALLILSGCATQTPAPENTAAVVSVVPDSDLPEFEAPDTTPDTVEAPVPEDSAAADIFADTQEPKDKVLSPTTKLALSRLYFNQRDLTKSLLLLESINVLELNSNQQRMMGLLAVELYLGLGQHRNALTWLAGPYAYVFDKLNREQFVQLSKWRADAWELNGQFLSAARERIAIAALLEPEEYQQNHQDIWYDLQLVDIENLSILASDPNPELSGWASLAYVSATTDRDLEFQIAAIKLWQREHPQHPAALQLPGGLDMLTSLVVSRPDHVGLLLPLSGSLQQTGEAIRDGFLAALYEAKSQYLETPKVTVIDTTKVSSMEVAYEQLLAEGVKLVIGPLLKQQVKDLQAYRGLRIPVLALNTSDVDLPFDGTFYQFGLNPEDEAIETARHARRLNFDTAAVLVPDGSWGDRVFNAFKSEFVSLGGTIVTQVHYTTDANRELLEVVRTLLNLDNSIARTALIEQVIGENVEYDARRRKDLDFIFMAAVPTDARQIKPLLDFQFASDVPVLATSTIYAGKKDPAADKDLEGIHFVDMPWQIDAIALKQQLANVLGDAVTGPYSRLYALGADAFQLYPRLRQFDNNATARVHGYTGTLSMDADGKLVRELEWAIVKRGVATPLVLTDDIWLK